MNIDQQKYILKNYRELSTRQLAKYLNLPRKAIEKYILELGNQKVLKSNEPISKKKEFLIVFALFIIAFSIRLFYIHLLKLTPFFEPLSKTLDDGVYNQMGQDIGHGNWLGKFRLGAYFIPIYPYFLAWVYRFFGVNIGSVHVVQCLFGSIVPILVYLIARQIFRNIQTALIAGTITCVYIPIIYFEHLLIPESLAVFFNSASFLLFLIGLKIERRGPLILSLSGFLFGISILLRSHFLLPVILLSLYLFYECFKHKSYIKKVFMPIVFLLAVLIPLSLNAARNYKLYGDFIPLSALGGLNFYLGNNTEADVKFRLAKEVGTSPREMIENSIQIAQNASKSQSEMSPSKVSDYWFRRAVHFMIESPVSFSRLLLKKTAWFFNNYECPDVLDIYFVSQFMPLLKVSFLSYGILTVFAMCGILISFRQKNIATILLEIFTISYIVSVITVFVTARYRIPIVPFFIIFAAFAIQKLIDFINQQKTLKLLGLIALAISLATVVFWPIEKINFARNYNSLAISMKNRGNLVESEKYYRQAMTIDPVYPSPYYNLSLLMDSEGRKTDAEDLRRQFEILKQRTG